MASFKAVTARLPGSGLSDFREHPEHLPPHRHRLLIPQQPGQPGSYGLPLLLGAGPTRVSHDLPQRPLGRPSHFELVIRHHLGQWPDRRGTDVAGAQPGFGAHPGIAVFDPGDQLVHRFSVGRCDCVIDMFDTPS